jgi:hypothetical protein
VSMSASMIPTSAAANIIIGNPDLGSGNSNPFGNPGTLWGPEYQQVYASSDFSGPITIRDLEFFNTQLLGGSPDSGSYTISLSTTSAQVDNLDFTTLSNNIGANNTVVFTGSLPSLVGGELHLVLSNPFTYNPVSGNLLIDVVSSDAGNTDTKLFLDAMNGDANGIFSRTYSTSGGSFNSGWGLVTGFSTGGAVPEPSTWAMILFGFASLGLCGLSADAQKSTFRLDRVRKSGRLEIWGRLGAALSFARPSSRSACRLAGLSALETYYADGNAQAQFGPRQRSRRPSAVSAREG